VNRTKIFTSLQVYSLLTSPGPYPPEDSQYFSLFLSTRHQIFIFISAPQHNNALTSTQNNDWTLLIFTNARSLPPRNTLHSGRVHPRFYPPALNHPLVLPPSQNRLSSIPSGDLRRYCEGLVFNYLDLDWGGGPG
jgi:hypothetical protein